MNKVNQEDIQNWREKNNQRTELVISLETILFIIIEGLALCGNVMVVIAVYRNKSLRSITHQYIVTLAITDFLVSLVILPLSIASSVTGQWPYGPDVCFFQGTCILIWACFSMCIVSITAVNRYFCVVKPNIYKSLFSTKKTFVTIAATLMTCSTLVIGFLLGYSGTFQFGPHLFCIPLFPTKHLQMSIMLPAFFFFILIPMLTMFVCYFKVYRRVRQHVLKVAPMLGRCGARSHRKGVEEARITKVVFVVLVLFFVLWTPICIIGTLFILGVTVIPRSVHLMYDFFIMANAASNPIVYGFFNKGFRSEYTRILGCNKFRAKRRLRITFSAEEFTGSEFRRERHENNVKSRISLHEQVFHVPRSCLQDLL